ncbi:YvcK family protein [Candidatus Poribacteria bacterium]|nr:YvcK family protein [Candidatus Poribacteria bacterium]MYB64824.1 YvcK family protein [Candidatus Poribacteria bacterium]MYF56579.1 YvcK family protein [Candidatus Poribacteria bacterium]
MSLKIACIGGGSGLSALLSGLKQYADLETAEKQIIDLDSLAAIVTVSDDGGSSGRLVEEFDVLPPGDIRRLLYTLSDADEIAGLFEYRFSSNGDLGGHTIGNLLLTALTKIQGNFPKAIQAASRLLSVRGQIIPVTLDSTVLCAELANGEIVKGESTIPMRENREPIKRVFFEQRENGRENELAHHSNEEDYNCQAHQSAIDALVNADAIIIGPGSLYTSIMPNLVIKGIVDTIQRSNAVKIYVCNVMTQPGETDGYAVTDHVNAILDHAKIPIDYVLANNQPAPKEIMQGYVRNELVSQLTRIKTLSEDGLSMLAEDTEHLMEVLNLAKDISTLSAETVQVADASKVQVSYNRELERLEDDGITVVEADLIRDMVVTEVGTWMGGEQMNVIRHDPEKLVTNLVNIFKNHPKLSEVI